MGGCVGGFVGDQPVRLRYGDGGGLATRGNPATGGEWKGSGVNRGGPRSGSLILPEKAASCRKVEALRRRAPHRIGNTRRLIASWRRRFDAVASGLLGAMKRLVGRGEQDRVVLAGLGNHRRDAGAEIPLDDAAGEAQLREAF